MKRDIGLSAFPIRFTSTAAWCLKDTHSADFQFNVQLQIKDEFRQTIKNQMLSQEMQRQINLDISVTPKEVKTFFKSIPEDSIPFINMKLSFQQIVFFPEITPDDKKTAMDKEIEKHHRSLFLKNLLT